MKKKEQPAVCRRKGNSSKWTDQSQSLPFTSYQCAVTFVERCTSGYGIGYTIYSMQN